MRGDGGDMGDYTLVFHREGGGRVTAGPFTGDIDELADLARSLMPEFSDVVAYSIWDADGIAIAVEQRQS